MEVRADCYGKWSEIKMEKEKGGYSRSELFENGQQQQAKKKRETNNIDIIARNVKGSEKKKITEKKEK